MNGKMTILDILISTHYSAVSVWNAEKDIRELNEE